MCDKNRDPSVTGIVLPLLSHWQPHGGRYGVQLGASGQASPGLADCPSGCWQVAEIGGKL